MTNRIGMLKEKAYIYEQKAWDSERYIIGVDEVGRGCLAGPLVAAAVVLKQGNRHRLLRDSKILTEKQREEAWMWIREHALAYGIGMVDHRCIDTYHIVEATRRAMRRGLSQLMLSSQLSFDLIEHVLVDALDPRYESLVDKTLFFCHGEDLSISVAAASIVAKVYRDKLLASFESSFCAYAFASHKGYGTMAHKRSLKECGRSLIHRTSFLGT